MNKYLIKNSFILLFSQLTNKLASFIYTVFLAKSLGVGNFGLYLVVLSYFSFATTLADLGISKLIIKEVSVNKNNIKTILAASVLTRLFIVTIFIAAFFTLSVLIDHDIDRRTFTLISFLALLPQCITLSLDSVFIGLQKIKLSAMGSVLSNLSTIILGYLFITKGLGVLGAVYALVIGQLIYVSFFVYMYTKFKLCIDTNIDINLIIKVFQKSLPYGILGILGILYFKIDTLILNYLRGNFETGIYGAAYKFLEAIVFIPSIVSTVLFPSLVQMNIDNIHVAKKISTKITSFMLPIGILVMLSYLIILPIIITDFLPSYELSLKVVKILALSIPFIFLHVPISQVMMTHESNLKKVIMFSSIPLSFNIIANFIFIPKYGYIGAAWITVVSDVLSLGVLFIMMYAILKNTKVYSRVTNRE